MPFSVIQSPEVRTRQDLALLCNARKLWQVAEVGTDIGFFAKQFLSQWKGEYYFCVDDYQPYDEMPYDRIGDLMVAVNALREFHPKVKFIRDRSPQAARRLPDWISLQLAYIDAAHDYVSVTADIQSWWDRLYSEEGHPVILAGHDFCDSHPGVIRAVSEFAESKKTTVYLTDEGIPSWYMYKTEPEYLLRVS